MDIKNSEILITGANRGIGRAVASMCAREGACLHLVNRSLESNLEAELLALGAAKVCLYQADLSTRGGVEDFLTAHGSIISPDILFNNAGQLTGGLLENQSLDSIYSLLQVNVSSLIHLSKAFLPGMLARRKGKIINHASVAAYMHFPASSVYSASKAAVVAFTESLRAELKGTGVSTLLLVTPGVKTRMFDEIAQKYGQNMDTSFLSSISPELYAEKIRRAILQDLPVLQPGGVTGLGLDIAKHMPGLFRAAVLRTFRR